jgi:serine/threonine-protein kinase
MQPERLDGDRYEVGRRLGHGGMATVYLAEDTKLGRPVAIKLLADNLAHDDDFRERFMREARLAAQLDHPNVVKVYDVSDDADRPFIVMEHVDGGTLGDVIKRRARLDPSEALRYLVQASDGLGHAHDRKLVHRDVKPHNLLIRESDGCVKVADFGIARAAEDTRLTHTGRVIGTDRYMAPEQLDGGDVTPATDVFSFGVVAGEVLGPDRDPAATAVIERCLSPDPRSRYRDANELREALSELADTADVVTRPATRTRAPAADDAPTAAIPAPSGSREPTAIHAARRGGRTRLLVGLALVAGIVAGALLIGSLLGGGGDDSDDGGGGGAATIPVVESPLRQEPAPRLEDPSQQAPALSDWIRANSE